MFKIEAQPVFLFSTLSNSNCSYYIYVFANFWWENTFEFLYNSIGKFDNATISKMKAPRCSREDIQTNNNNNNFLFSSLNLNRWKKWSISYFIESYTNDMNNGKIDSIINDALNRWTKVTPLQFQKKNDINADIIIR